MPVLVLLISLACGGQAGSAGPAEASTSFGRCGERWISDPGDPRVGIYVFERYLAGEEMASAFMNVLAYDGESVILRWLSNHSVGESCTYGSHETAPTGMVRMHARVTPDGALYSLQPCHGWVLVGHFIDGGLESGYPMGPAYALRRVTARELDGALGAELAQLGLFDCRDIYEGARSIPPLPRHARSTPEPIDG